jgi:hypothetical protein
MGAQQKELATFMAKLRTIDPTGWPIPQQVDYYLVRAEMNGLDFDHRVLRPWANNPAFYVTAFMDESDQPAREGPLAVGGVDLWKYTKLSAADVAEIDGSLRVIPALLQQARTNLNGTQKDLWTYGTKAIRQESADLAAFAAKLGDTQPALKVTVDKAREAADAMTTWLDGQAAGGQHAALHRIDELGKMTVAVVEAAFRVGDADHRALEHLVRVTHALRERAPQVQRKRGIAVISQATGDTALRFFAHEPSTTGST